MPSDTMGKVSVQRLVEAEFADRRLFFFQGGDNLGGTHVCHDFDWKRVVGHGSKPFRYGKSLCSYVTSKCPQGKTPVLYLTESESSVRHLITDELFVAVVPWSLYHRTACNDPARSFFAYAAESSGINLLDVSVESVKENETADFIRRIWKVPDLRSEVMRTISALKKADSAQDEADLESVFDLEHFVQYLRMAAASSEYLDQISEQFSTDGLDPSLDSVIEDLRSSVRRKVLREFEEKLSLSRTSNSLSEPAWEDFFRRNPWLLGLNLKECVFLNELQKQPDLGSHDISGAGNIRGDSLMATLGERMFSVLVELKTPEAELVCPKKYRNATFSPGADVVGGVMQVQRQCYALESENENESKRRELRDRHKAFTVKPRGIVVVGNLDSLVREDEEDKIICFELYRTALHGVVVVTYDEVLSRARELLNG